MGDVILWATPTLLWSLLYSTIVLYDDQPRFPITTALGYCDDMQQAKMWLYTSARGLWYYIHLWSTMISSGVCDYCNDPVWAFKSSLHLVCEPILPHHRQGKLRLVFG